MKLHVATVEKIKTFNALLEKADRPTAYDFERVEAYINGLFSFAKFSIGEKVEMAKTYPVTKEESWGWMSCRHLLTKGSRAIVREVDYRNERFVYLIEFEEASWINDKGEIKSKEETTNLYLSEGWLTKASPNLLRAAIEKLSPKKEQVDAEDEDKGKAYPGKEAAETKDEEKRCSNCKCGQGNRS